jgi:hypothetical protein
VSASGDALVGRSRELASLTATLERAAAGEGGVALVSGEPGIGKTRLLEEIASCAAARGFAVSWGRAWELGSAPTYWPWIEVLRSLIARPDGGESGRALVPLLPELAARSQSAPQARPAALVDGFALCDAVTGYLLATSERTPLLVVLDDLHAADLSSLQLAEFVARSLRSARLCLVGSHRDFEARRTPEIESALSRLARSGTRHLLSRLAVDEVATLVQAETGRDDSGTARMIHDATEGNPLFVRELLRLIAARGAAHGGGVPAGVRAVIRERLALLTPASVALLQAAAVAGREFALRLAAEVAGVTPAALDEAASEARAADLLTEQRPGRWRFSHALVAETLAAELHGPQRARLHRRAAEALERWQAEDPTAVSLDEIAYHWLAAGSDAADRAAVAAARAAEAAAARLAFADAAASYESALGALALAAPDAVQRRGELLILQTEAWVRSGERARAERTCTAAAEIATATRDGVLLARAALALGAEGTVGYVDAALIRVLERAMERVPEGDGPWRARVMARLASARQPEPDPHSPMALAREAIAMARRLGDPEVLLHTLHSALGALVDYGPAAERAALNREVVQLAAAAGDRVREFRARTRLMFDYAQLEDFTRFDGVLVGYDAMLRETDQPRYGWVPLMFHSMRANWEGRFADGARLEAEARAMHEHARGDGPPLVPARGLGLGILRADPDAIKNAVDTLKATYPSAREFGTIFDVFASMRFGQLDEGRELVRSMVDSADAAKWFGDLHFLEILSDAAWHLRDAPLARMVQPLLMQHQGELFMITGIAYSMHDAIDHALMMLSTVLGDLDAADRYARAALALCARTGGRPLAARVRHDWAIALRERATGEAIARAHQLWTEALASAEALGMVALAASCRARLAETVMPVAESALPPPSAASANIALRLEGETWTVQGAGGSCRVRDNRGMRMLAQLIEQPGRELHVFELSGVTEPVDGGDAGTALDREARTAYEQRVRELQAEIDEAETANDSGRRERLQDEYEQLCAELSRAFGLGGRARRSGAAVERARVNVRRRLTLALEHIAKVCPALGDTLSAAVQTGVYCVYRPKP